LPPDREKERGKTKSEGELSPLFSLRRKEVFIGEIAPPCIENGGKIEIFSEEAS
jgi:hypothetical protein